MVPTTPRRPVEVTVDPAAEGAVEGAVEAAVRTSVPAAVGGSAPPTGPTPPGEPETAAPPGPSALEPVSGRRAAIVLAGLAVGLVVVCLVAVARGAFPLTIGEVVATLADRVGIRVGTLPDELAQSVLWDIRVPRVLLGVLIGVALGVAGALMQGTFANPLAEPGIVGVSSGAALGAVLAIVVGFTAFGTWSISSAAFLGGLAAVVLVYASARSGGRTEVVTLVLTGVALNAMTGALIGMISYFSTDAELRSITFWLLGSLAQATWPKVAVVAPMVVLATAVAWTQARRLDVLALGEAPARHLGVDVERLRMLAMVCVAVLTASAVAFAGIITFVGLVIPHLVRMLVGPGHTKLLPASMLAGALIVVLGDLIARTAAAPAEIPLGTLTALVGSPVFFVLLRRTRRQQGGWA
ncbi:MAG TPA: iron ABC transporter permease [Ilumatobacteraceae bacterium]|nr:iron ABC transporter permease [Ilumatobacteraceae bacterium]